MHLINLETIKQNHPLYSVSISKIFYFIFGEKYKFSMDFQLTDPFHFV